MVVSSVPPISPSTSAPALGVRGHQQVGTVIERDLRLAFEQRHDVLHVRVEVLATDRAHLDAVIQHERRGDVVLGRQRVGRAQRHLRAARLERPHEAGGLGGDVQAGGDPDPVQRPLVTRGVRRSWQARASGWRPRRFAPRRRRPARGRLRHGAEPTLAPPASSGSGPTCTDRRPAPRDTRPATGVSAVSRTPSASRCSRATFSSRCLASV